MFEEALADLERWLQGQQQHGVETDSPAVKAWIGVTYAIVGRSEEAKRILREYEEASTHEQPENVNYRALALMHWNVGSKDQAFDWLQRGFENRTNNPVLVKSFPLFDELTSDPRFDELLKKKGIAERIPHCS